MLLNIATFQIRILRIDHCENLDQTTAAGALCLNANRIISKQFTSEFLTKDPVLHTEEKGGKSPLLFSI